MPLLWCLGFVKAMLWQTNVRGVALSVAVSIKHRLVPVAKFIAPRWFWRRKFHKMRRCAQCDPELMLVRSLCEPARVSLDIGADAGQFSIAMLESSLSTIAFEPRPSQARALAQMFDAVGAPVRVEAVALSDQSGWTTMRVLESDPGRSTIDNANPLIDEDGSQVGTIEVPVRRLDDLALGDVGFIKIDVEGHELAVLRGATETLKRNRPALLVEAEERHHPDAVGAIAELLSTLGYTGYFDLDGTRRPIAELLPDEHQNPSNITGWKEGSVRRGVYVNNFVFLPD
jgi:FkbM family methyltransferase